MDFSTWERIKYLGVHGGTIAPSASHSPLLCCTQLVGVTSSKIICYNIPDDCWFKLVHTHRVCAVIQLYKLCQVMGMLMANGSSATELVQRDVVHWLFMHILYREPILSEMLLHWRDLPVSLEKWHQKSWSMHRSSWRYSDNEEAVLS